MIMVMKKLKLRSYEHFVIKIMLTVIPTFQCVQYIHNKDRLSEDVSTINTISIILKLIKSYVYKGITNVTYEIYSHTFVLT